RRLGRVWADDFETDTLHPLQRLTPRHERRQEKIAERTVVEEQRSQRVALDGDVAEGLGDDRGQKDRLPGQEVHLAQELRGAMTDDLVVRSVEDRYLALQDRDQGIALMAAAKQHIADARGWLIAVLGARSQ